VTDDDDLVPVSVRLGQVVPPEDPEDWTRPLTWVAALGLLAAPAVAITWFAVAPPQSSEPAAPATLLLAAVLAGGAALTAATQQGAQRAFAATLAAALFAAVATIAVGALMAGERQVATASPTVAHAFGASVAGLVGAVAASPLAARLAGVHVRWPRVLGPGAIGAAVALLIVPVLLGGPSTPM
jgi:hypothetical protein